VGNVSHVVLYSYRVVENPIPGMFELISMSDLARLAGGTQGYGSMEGGFAPSGPGPGEMPGVPGRGGDSAPPVPDSGSPDGMMGASPGVPGKQWAALGGIRISGAMGSMGPDATGMPGGGPGMDPGAGPGMDPRASAPPAPEGGRFQGSPDGGRGTPDGGVPTPFTPMLDPTGRPISPDGTGFFPGKPRKAQFSRSEFIIVFVWKEPVSPAGEAVPTEEIPASEDASLLPGAVAPP
jgi:hypothetical protein